MPESKIELKIGAIEFSATGDDAWVAAQLDKLLSSAKSLVDLSPPPAQEKGIHGNHQPMGQDPDIAQKPLASFLKDKNATTAQVTKFLATAVWLEAKGKSRLTTADVTSALKDANQSRLGNPADCLNQNVKKGFCEKDGKQFYVTQEGKESL